jgi:hypothetical protein
MDIDQAIRIWIRQYSVEIDQAIRIRQYGDGSGNTNMDQAVRSSGMVPGIKDRDHAVWR